MVEKKHISVINEINQIAAIGDHHKDADMATYGIGEYAISFLGKENKKLFYHLSDQLYFKIHPEVASTFSKKTFENEVVNLIRVLKNEERSCHVDDVRKLIEGLLNRPNENYEIFYPTYGFDLDLPIFELSKTWTLYNYNLSKDDISQKYPGFQSRYDSGIINSNILLAIKVKSRDQRKADELADDLANTFEIIAHYMVGWTDKRNDFGVFNARDSLLKTRIVCKNSFAGFSMQRDPLDGSIDLSNQHFLCQKCGNNQIWELFEKHKSTKIKERITTAITWIGRGLQESNISNSFLFFIFSIESLVQYDDHPIINSSIMSSISDNVAFILSNNTGERQETAKKIKKLYVSRSKIAHGGNSRLNPEDVKEAYLYAIKLVRTFLTQKPYTDFQSIDNLKDHINNLKFS